MCYSSRAGHSRQPLARRATSARPPICPWNATAWHVHVRPQHPASPQPAALPAIARVCSTARESPEHPIAPRPQRRHLCSSVACSNAWGGPRSYVIASPPPAAPLSSGARNGIAVGCLWGLRCHVHPQAFGCLSRIPPCKQGLHLSGGGEGVIGESGAGCGDAAGANIAQTQMRHAQCCVCARTPKAPLCN